MTDEDVEGKKPFCPLERKPEGMGIIKYNIYICNKQEGASYHFLGSPKSQTPKPGVGILDS